ncbi:MAG: GNAT family N-acetyltransferase [Dehalococcoidia bacterium]|nr:MAG: GNAT family N-acetyltransferase [Dehalococcoidia bacterium]
MKEVSYKFADSEGELEGAFVVWRQVFVAEQGIPENLVYDGNDRAARHLVVKEGQRVIGAARVRFLAAGQAKLERMAVLFAFRHLGIGQEMVDFLVGELRGEGIKKLILHAQHQVVEFYQTCGFKPVGRPFVEAGIKHQKMERIV